MVPHLRVLDRPRVVRVSALTTYPLAGVLAIVAVFFMITASFAHVGGIAVKAWRQPKGIARAMGLLGWPPPVVIAVKADSYEVSSKSVTPWRSRGHDRDGLLQLLRGLVRERTEIRSAVLRADEGVRYQALIDVTETCRDADLEVHIALETDTGR